MKKIKKLLFIVALVLFCSSCNQDSKLKNLSYSELKNKLSNNDTFFFVVIKDGCQHCENFVPKVKEVLDEYNISGYTINYTNLSSEDNDSFYEDFQVDSTPTTIFIKDGKEISILQRITGNVSKEKLIDKLKSNDYIK